MISIVILTNFDSEEQTKSLTETTNQLQQSLDISQGKMITGALFRLGEKDRILLIVHHLVIDGVSWRILLEDLATCYQQLEQNQPLKLPTKTTSYQQWSKKLTQYAQQATITKELDYWLKVNQKPITSLPIDKPANKTHNAIASTQQISVSLDSKNTHTLLTEVPKAYNTRIDDVLLTALTHSFYLWTKSSELLLDLENYGRQEIAPDINISRTVGWFTSIYPVRLKIDSFTKPGESLKLIKEQLRAYPNQGFNYSILKYLNPEVGQKLKQLASPEIAFNYLGQIQPTPKDSLIQSLTNIETKSSRHPQAIRRYLIEIYGLISHNRLTINWIYSNNFHNQETITELANNFLKYLETLIKHCQASETKKYTPSDFSAAKINQNQLDALISQINKFHL